MKRSYYFSLFLTLYLLMGTAWASSIPSPPSINKVIALSAGPAWYHAGRTETIWLQPDFANTYDAFSPQKVLTSGELFLGLQKSFSNLDFMQLGLALAASGDAKLQGEIWETADPLFNNFSYQYKIFHKHLALKGKYLFNRWSSTLLPYVSASLGVALNKSYHFSMTPLIFEALPVPGFQSHQETAFTYTVGTGVQKILDVHWQLGLGYEFSDWGQSSLSRAPGQTINSGLSLSHLNTQELQVTLNYLF
ncbi:MAG: outer membrane beta-barrel protein [Legionellaceae bacterium]|nr:outer membrane beta-barrel protein [Legionellaceae bacterium]